MRLLQAGPGPGRWLEIWGLGFPSGAERGGGRVHVAGGPGVSLGRTGRQGSGSEQGPSARPNGCAPGSPGPGSEGLSQSRSEAGPGSRRRHAPQLAAGWRRGGPIEGEQRARPWGQGVAGRRPLPGGPALFTLPKQSAQYSD